MPESHHRSCQHNAYRLNCEDFEALWAYAEGRCQICRTLQEATPRGILEIDHDGHYGYFAVRGLLCGPCNLKLGQMDRAQSHDRRTRVYLAQAWFVRVLEERHAKRVRDRRAARSTARRT